jgi:hypothetical protein
MAVETSALMGSGTVPYTVGILHTTLGGTFNGTLNVGAADGRGIRRGTQVIVANPEDIVSAPAFRCSGITVGTTPVNISNAISRAALLKRTTRVIIENVGGGDLYIGGTANVNASLAGEAGFKLINPTAGAVPPQTLPLPVMEGADIWAVASAATDVRILVY